MVRHDRSAAGIRMLLQALVCFAVSVLPSSGHARDTRVGTLLDARAPAVSAGAGTQAQDGVAITFLANEGVMLASGARKVLIDGLFLKYKRDFAVPADSTQVALQAARAPFNAVDVVLVTHFHGDHFHPRPIANHLRSNPRAALVASQQALDSLGGRISARDRIASRLLARTMVPGTRRREVINGVNIELLGLPHGGHPHVEHIGYIVELGGRRVLHVGDADLSADVLAPFRLDTSRIDVALIPYGAITNRKQREVIERWVRPRQFVGFHVGDSEVKSAAREVRAALPGAIAFTRSLETRRW